MFVSLRKNSERPCDTVIYNKNIFLVFILFLAQRSQIPWDFLSAIVHNKSLLATPEFMLIT